MYLVSKLKLDIDQILCASSYLGQMVQKFMFVPGYVENWIVVLDFNGQGLLDTSISVSPIAPTFLDAAENQRNPGHQLHLPPLQDVHSQPLLHLQRHLDSHQMYLILHPFIH